MERVEPVQSQSLQQQNNVNNSNQIYYHQQNNISDSNQLYYQQQNQNQEHRQRKEPTLPAEITVDKQETKSDNLRNQSSPVNESNKNNNTNSGLSGADTQNRTKDSLAQGKSGQQSTQNGIAKLNGVNPKNANNSGNNLSESVASTDDHSSSSNANFSKTNLYIKGLQQSTTDQDLYNMCSRFGKISSTKAILEPNDNTSCRGKYIYKFLRSCST